MYLFAYRGNFSVLKCVVEAVSSVMCKQDDADVDDIICCCLQVVEFCSNCIA